MQKVLILVFLSHIACANSNPKQIEDSLVEDAKISTQATTQPAKKTAKKIKPIATNDTSTFPLLHSVRSRYSQSNSVSMAVDKTVVLEVLEQEKKSKAKMVVGKGGKLRFESLEEPKSVTIMNEKKAMIVDYPDKDFGGPIKVLLAKLGKVKQSQTILKSIMGNENLTGLFEIALMSQNDPNYVYEMKAKKADMDVKRIQISINSKADIIQRITYWDQIGNKTDLQFSDVNFSTDENPKAFDFKIPKNADVTEL